MQPPLQRSEARPVPAAVRRTVLGFGLRELGVTAIAVALLVLGGAVWRSTVDRNQAEAEKQVRGQLALLEDAAVYYRERFSTLQATAAQLRQWADAQSNEPLRTWARERARRFEALVGSLNREPDVKAWTDARPRIEALLARGELDEAVRRLQGVPLVTFPGPSELARQREALFERPLAEFSRQNPGFYRALRQHEPELATRDEAALRAELRSAVGEALTPQRMLQLELLEAVAAPDDPLVAGLRAPTDALDYFENPDAATTAAWATAQSAQQRGDWNAAVRAMQHILASAVATRQPFRAAFGRALLRSRPDQPEQAYPYLAEAAASGDQDARRWVAREDLRQNRLSRAQRWLEAAVAEGDRSAREDLVRLYQAQPDRTSEEATRQAAVLEGMTANSDAPADAWHLLGRLYERHDAPGSSARKAFHCYRRAAERGSAAANLDVARCAWEGIGTERNPEIAREAVCRAWSGGEREPAAAMMMAMLQAAPEFFAPVLLRTLEANGGLARAGYSEQRTVDGPGVAALTAELARQLDRNGDFAGAARLYAVSGDAAAARRHAELVASHACERCGGKGTIQATASCPTCAGKGSQTCSFCGGTGSIFKPGSPPCTSCGGSGNLVQDRRVVACASCGGSGKGKGSVVKEDCVPCEGGQVRCTACESGRIKVPRECPDCEGQGTWSMVGRKGMRE